MTLDENLDVDLERIEKVLMSMINPDEVYEKVVDKNISVKGMSDQSTHAVALSISNTKGEISRIEEAVKSTESDWGPVKGAYAHQDGATRLKFKYPDQGNRGGLEIAHIEQRQEPFTYEEFKGNATRLVSLVRELSDLSKTGAQQGTATYGPHEKARTAKFSDEYDEASLRAEGGIDKEIEGHPTNVAIVNDVVKVTMRNINLHPSLAHLEKKAEPSNINTGLEGVQATYFGKEHTLRLELESTDAKYAETLATATSKGLETRKIQ